MGEKQGVEERDAKSIDCCYKPAELPYFPGSKQIRDIMSLQTAI